MAAPVRRVARTRAPRTKSREGLRTRCTVSVARATRATKAAVALTVTAGEGRAQAEVVRAEGVGTRVRVVGETALEEFVRCTKEGSEAALLP